MTVREINKLCQKAAMGRGGYVFADIGDQKRQRIVHARTIKGQLQVLVLSTWTWETPNVDNFNGVLLSAVYAD